jgi:hypothetical protein
MCPHFGQRIRSKSIRTTSAGVIGNPQDGQIVFSVARTFGRLILFFCIGELQTFRLLFDIASFAVVA